MSKLITGMLMGLVMWTTGHTTELQTRTSMNTQQITLWQLIETLVALPSFALDTIRQIIPTEFKEHYRSASFSSYEGGPLRLADQVTIEMVELRIRHKDGMSRLLGLDIDICKVCVTLDEVRKHYSDIVIISTPQGHSLDETTVWGIQQPWGQLSFGFKEGNPHCLSDIGIRRNDPSPASTPPPK